MNNQIGKNIRDLRNEKSMTQDQLAETLHVTRQAVSNWENGKTEPGIDTLTQIAELFDVSIERVLYGQKKSKVHVSVKNSAETGIGFGSVLAMIISYTAWKSIGWAILHGIFGWAYVIYYAIKY